MVSRTTAISSNRENKSDRLNKRVENYEQWSLHSFSPPRRSAAKKTYPWWKRFRVENTRANWTEVSPLALMGCTHKYWGSWQVSLWSHCLLSLIDYGTCERKADVNLIFKKGRKEDSRHYRPVCPTGSRQGNGTNYPGNHFQTHKRQEGDQA